MTPEGLALLDAAPCGLMRTTDNGAFVFANRAFCSSLGVSAESLVARRRFQDLLTMGGKIFHQTHWSPLLRMQGSIAEVKLDLIHADGSLVPMVLNAIRHEENGTMFHELAAFVARDRDAFEKELVHSRNRLEALVAEATRHQEEARDRVTFAEQMIGIVSHDLRNPLSSITMAAALLAGSELTPKQSNVLAKLTRSTERASRLIGDLLDFTQARLGSGLPVDQEVVDIHHVTAEVVDELGLAHPNRKLQHLRSGQGPCLADPARLAQLTGNLVSNAIAYGDPATNITVRSEIGADAFSLSVHNEGPSIPREVQATLFRPMTRGNHVSKNGRSVGLGLFIVNEIAKAHGGSTIVESSAEAGTVFRVVFPRRTTKDAA